ERPAPDQVPRPRRVGGRRRVRDRAAWGRPPARRFGGDPRAAARAEVHSQHGQRDRKSTRLNSSHVEISYAVFCLKKKKKTKSTPCRCGRGRKNLAAVARTTPPAAASLTSNSLRSHTALWLRFSLTVSAYPL